MGYIGSHGVQALKRYKYSGVDHSYLAKYVLQPFWSRFVNFFPLWMPPNMITLTGFMFLVTSTVLGYEKDLKVIREAEIREEMLDREASLRRARAEASLSDGISWGMGEDAIEEVEDDGPDVEGNTSHKFVSNGWRWLKIIKILHS
ncbi:hypothetical protein E1A91_D04G128300v1 [Gossypium mustelinum]|uniref:Uncharacterized protein n=1 Tax=Gossypium mustelinum TaxID=34275 RepID=A0A5D2VDD3_GOSMU|nr:hypothetical protein E1A91_D04G128300v1 [Gossypium mustelinum]TYI87337.1 hypothetical protein E1A91_D04G128300v1 [Gossypium mustelinum]TYI87339.1 hypothetical protein E1A91_D04G128300v1 [Gossypium mustelinum]